MNIKGITISVSDLFTMAGWAVALIATVLHTVAKKLPAPAAAYLNRIGESEIRRLIETAAELYRDSPAMRQRWVTQELQRLAKKKLGLEVPDSIANLLVEWVYSKVKRPKKPVPLVPVLILILAVFVFASPVQAWTVQDLGPGTTVAIDNAGAALGQTSGAAWIYDGKQLAALENAPIGGTVTGMNDDGTVVGYQRQILDGKPVTHGWIWKSGAVSWITDNGYAIPTCINNAGTVGYWTYEPTGPKAKVRMSNAVTVPVAGGFIYGLNDLGFAVGRSDYTGNGAAAFWSWYNPAQLVPAFSPPGYGWATGVNESLMVVGRQLSEFWLYHAFVWQYGAPRATDLGESANEVVGYDTSSGAAAINGAGDIVGYLYSTWQYCPCYWSPSGICEVLPLPPRCTSGNAVDINDAGVACGWVSGPEGTRAVIWRR